MKTDEAVLVLVINQDHAEKLIRAGHDLAEREGGKLRVLSVQPRVALGGDCADALERLFSYANQMQADMTVYYNDDAAGTVAGYIHRQNITRVIVGSPPLNSESSFLKRLRKECKNLAVYIIDEENQRQEDNAMSSATFLSPLANLAIAGAK